MNTPTPILDSADARWVELAAFIAMHPEWQGPAIEDFTPDERAQAHAYFIHGIGNDERDGIPADADAAMTTVGLLRIISGSVPDPKDDPTGDEALGRLLGRFDGREHLLLNETMNYIEFLMTKLGVHGDTEANHLLINEFWTTRSNALGLSDQEGS